MSDSDEVPAESPATWENVVVGKAMQAAGEIMNDDELADEGREQAEIAQEVRQEYDEERSD